MTTAKALYQALTPARSTVLDRARDASRLTIPGLIPEASQDEHYVSEQPYNSVAARGVASLAARSLVALFPPNLPFFRLQLDASVAKELGTDLGEANLRMSLVAGTAYSMMEAVTIRPIMNEALRHLIVAGNGLIHIPMKGAPRFFRLDQYVCKRDHTGQFVTLVIHERVLPSVLPEATRAACKVTSPADGNDKPIDVYTVVRREGVTVTQYQEINDLEVPGSKGTAPAEACGWLPLRWLMVPGSDYGRSHVTEYIGDILSLEDLTKAMVQFATVASRIIGMVDPNSGIDLDELMDADTGTFLAGYADKVKFLQLEKHQDWAVMSSLAERLEQRVSNAFLLRGSAVRNAERVTAEEVRMIAEELETTLGGTYSVLSAEMQLPLVRRFLHIGARQNRLPALPKSIHPNIVTGFDALGRAAAVNRIRMFLADASQMLGPQQVMAYVNGEEILKRLGEGYAVEGLDSILKTPEQRQAEQQEAATGQAAVASAPHLIKAVSDAASQPE
ncbi:portal protein [Caulobacter vibrioides]|uniref:Head-tail connector n=1 Tax=Caulobacter phage S2B TaxID=2759120 RepID=A0AAE7ML46_9CAUD|nr:portal protein [Caulobacter vibrioides]QOC54143.1 head-tail connector [Caulobacter phage S2B]QXZ50183.1 head-tail connector protein [Caulobacter vibrioides]